MKKKIWISVGFLLAFVLWTYAVSVVDVQPIGPEKSCVGFAAVNGPVHDFFGVRFTLYHLTEWMGLVPVVFGMGFAVLGLIQWIKRKHVLRVDRSLLILGAFYILVIAAYLYFESHAVNFRPVLIEGRLEASYPSSTTLLTLCVMPTAWMQLRSRMRVRAGRKVVCYLITAFTVFMVIGRLLSGVHWLTDIIGGVLLSAGLVVLYDAFAGRK